MADDWAQALVAECEDELQEKLEKEQDDKTRQGYARDGAQEEFREIRGRIGSDLDTLRKFIAFQPTEMEDSTDIEFNIRHRGNISMDVNVRLLGTTIECKYQFPEKPPETKTLRICSDLQKSLKIYRNGSGEAFVSSAAVSDFILRPLFEYVRRDTLGQRRV